MHDTPTTEHKHRTFHFCSTRCRERFELFVERLAVRDAARAGALLTQGKVRWGLA